MYYTYGFQNLSKSIKLMHVLDQYTESRDCLDDTFTFYDLFRECVYLPPTAHSWHCLSGCALESKPAFLDVNDSTVEKYAHEYHRTMLIHMLRGIYL